MRRTQTGLWVALALSAITEVTTAHAQPADGLQLAPGDGLALTLLGGSLLAGLLYYLARGGRQRRALAALEHAHLAAIVANANDAIIGKSLTGVVTSWNKSAERIFGYSAEEAIGKQLSALVVPSDRQHEEVAILSSIARGEAVPRFEAVRKCKDGRLIDVSVSVSPVRTDGRVVGASKIVQDITEIQLLQRTLRSTLGRLQMAVDAAGIGVWVWDFASRELTWDARMYELYEVTQQPGDGATLQKTWRARIHPEDLDLVDKNLSEQLEGTGKYNTEFRMLRSDGSVRYMQVAATVERDRDGRPLRVVGIDRDVSEAKIAQAHILQLNASLEDQIAERTSELHEAMRGAERANQSKSEFLANMSHEIRTPMNAILGLSYLLQKQDLAPSARNMVQNISTAGQSLLAIINDILDFSKIEARRLQVEHVPFRLSEVLDSLASILGASKVSRDTELIVGPVPSGYDYVKGDATRLGQVLINLAGNAVKFTPSGSVVISTTVVDADAAGRRVRLRFSIRDTGIGIPHEKQRTIFDAFTQADSSTVRRFGGTGLGLTISRSLVELMNGQLTLQSEPGVGSEFAFEIPFEVSDPEHVATPEMAHQQVLIVDDHEIALQTLCATATSLGWSSAPISSGEAAIDVMTGPNANDYDIVVLDWHMPVLDGLQAAAQIRKSGGAGLRSPIIIMVSSSEREAMLARPESAAVDGILTKPVTSSSLYDAVLAAKRSRGQLGQAAVRTEQVRLQGVRVLIVDDSELNREVALNILEGEGARAEVACDGLAACELLEKRPSDFDVVLMDVQMPTMDGYTATRRIRGTLTLQNLPIVGLSAGAFKQQHDDAIAAGMADFVAKPFDVDKLVTVIARLTSPAKHTPQANVTPAPDNHSLIDVARGLRYWRTTGTFQTQLWRFLALHAQDAQAIVQALDERALDRCSAVAHKLAGAAEVVGLQSIADVARKLEHSQDEVEARQLTQALRAAIERSRQAIAKYAPREPAAPIQAPVMPANDNERRERTLKLLAALDSDDLSEIEPLLPNLPSILSDPQAQQFVARVSAYDFRGAEAILVAAAEVKHG